MDYTSWIKPLALPDGFNPPAALAFDDIRARAISRADLDDDVRGINASIDLIQRTRGGRWPTGPVTAEYNYADLVWHEVEFRDGNSLTYAVYDDSGRYLGCCYLYPMGKRTPLTVELSVRDVDVSWWVTPTAHEKGYYLKLYAALQHWMAEEFGFWSAHYSNASIPADPAPAEQPSGEYTARRHIPASRPRVFEAFTDPQLFALWFVVPGYRTPTNRVVIDPRHGGGVQAVMVSETDGAEIPFAVHYDDFDPPGRISMRFSDHTERLEATLADRGTGRTLLEYHASGTPEADLNEARRITENQLDRLVVALAHDAGTGDS